MFLCEFSFSQFYKERKQIILCLLHMLFVCCQIFKKSIVYNHFEADGFADCFMLSVWYKNAQKNKN